MPNKQLYADVKSAFVSQQTSLNKWCLENNVHRQNARHCLLGAWKGKKGLALRQRLIIAAGIAVDSTGSDHDQVD
jgi:hypothetical protein